MAAALTGLSLQLRHVVEVHGALEAIQRDDEDREELPVEVAELARERDEVQVRGIENELDRHENRQKIAPDQHAGHPDGEEQERERDVVRDADHQSTCSMVRFPSTTAPIIATSRNTDTISNGSR